MSSSSPDSAAEAPALPEPDVWASRLTTISVASALFMQAIDSTALSTALPTLARAFHANPIELKLCLTAYIMALAVFVPASAWAADRFGAKRVFSTAVGVFLMGSVLCALSQSLAELVAARILQGAGGAMMLPVARMIVIGAHPREELVKAMAWLTTPAMLGPILGPPLSGFILSFADWPWIFYINVPVGLLGMALVLRFVPKLRQPHPGRFDTLGFVLAAGAICAVMIGAESVGVNLLPVWGQVAVWLIGAAAALGYWRHAKGMERPVLNLRLLKVQTFRANQTGGSLVRLTVGAQPFLLPLLLQGGLGWTPLRAGLLTISGAVGAICARSGAQYFLARFGFRPMLIFTSLTCSATMVVTGFYRNSTPLWLMVGILGVGGFLRSNHMTSANTLAYADLPDSAVSQASSLTAMVQQLAQAFGITVAGLLLRVSQVLGAAHGLRPLAPENFILPFAVIGLIGMSAAGAYWFLPANTGSNMHGRRRRR